MFFLLSFSVSYSCSFYFSFFPFSCQDLLYYFFFLWYWDMVSQSLSYIAIHAQVNIEMNYFLLHGTRAARSPVSLIPYVVCCFTSAFILDICLTSVFHSPSLRHHFFEGTNLISIFTFSLPLVSCWNYWHSCSLQSHPSFCGYLVESLKLPTNFIPNHGS